MMKNGKQQISNINPDVYILRSRSKTLSKQKVIDMIKKYCFFDANKNPKGTGFSHKYFAENINGKRIVTDEVTHLMWQQSGVMFKTECGDATSCIEELNRKCFAGYNDWRLPTLEEAMSLVEREKGSDSLYIDPVFNKKQSWIWTSDLDNNGGLAWYVSFLSGCCGNTQLFNYGYEHVRAVRSINNTSSK